MCRDFQWIADNDLPHGFNAARSIVCVETSINKPSWKRKFRFNAARSIVCVETFSGLPTTISHMVSMPHAALCVSRLFNGVWLPCPFGVSMPHAALCVSRHRQFRGVVRNLMKFQCRTQHCVCRDAMKNGALFQSLFVSMPHAALCVSRHCVPQPLSRAG